MNYTKNKLNIALLALIPLFFMFLPSFCILFGAKPILIFFIANVIFFAILCVLKPLNFINHLISLYRNTSFKYYTYWSLWVILSGLILFIIGKYSLVHYIYYLILYLVINMLLTFLIPTFIIKNDKTLNFMVKFITSAIYIILLLGIINFIGEQFNINIIAKFFDFINNQRSSVGNTSTAIMYSSKVFSVFAEPGWFGCFISLFLPLTFAVSRSKYKLYKNFYLNILVKKTIVLLSLLNLVFTLSPIWLIIGFIIYFVLISIQIIKMLRSKIKVIISLIIIWSFLLLGAIKIFNDSQNEHYSNNVKYLSRITNTMQAIVNRDYYMFICLEPSLASRISSYVNSLRIFLDFPITGIGIGNSKFFMAQKFETSPVYLTQENYLRLSEQSKQNYIMFNSAFLYELLSETGLIGFLLYYYFLYQIYRQIKRKRRYYIGINRDFIDGLINIFPILFFVVSIYDVGLMNIHVWLILGVCISIEYISKKHLIILKKENINE